MLSVLLAFIGAAIYGASDFFGGRAAARMSSVRVTAINSVTGVVLLLAASLFIPGHFSGGAWLWGVLAGLCGAAALGLLYACLAVGPMSILAPIMALVSAVVPIGVGFASGERLSTIGYLGLVVGLLAIVLICFVPDVRAVRPSNRGVAMAAAAGLAVGLYLVFIDRTPHDSGITPLILTFAVSGVVMGAILLVQHFSGRTDLVERAHSHRRSPLERARSTSMGTLGAVSGGGVETVLSRSPVALSLYSGLTDAGACVLFLVALRVGDLSVVSVLNALSPAGTIVLAAVILKERIAPVQWTGLVVALAAAAMLAVA